MNKQRISIPRYRRIFFLGLIVIVFGILFSTTLKDNLGSLGTVFIAVGGLLLIAAMAGKKNINDKQNQNE